MKNENELLQKSGLKITKGRKGIIKILTASTCPLDVVEINNLLEKDAIFIDNATVYRILEAFVTNNIAQRVEFQEGKFRYELAALPHHHHAVCTNCGSIQDIEECDMGELGDKINKDIGFKTSTHTMEFFGHCVDCQ